MRSLFCGLIVSASLSLPAAIIVAGCGGGTTTTTGQDSGTTTVSDGGVADSSIQVTPDLGCYANPMTHLQIINACTTAQALDKSPVLPRLTDGGNLPPLP